MVRTPQNMPDIGKSLTKKVQILNADKTVSKGCSPISFLFFNFELS